MSKRKRSPLAPGNRYTFPGFARNGFEVKWLTFQDNDGLKGVAVKWFGYGRSRMSGFYAFKSERAFWSNYLFKAAVDSGS